MRRYKSPPRNQRAEMRQYRQIGVPEPGFWVLKAVKHGPRVPARIFWTENEPGEPENHLDRGGKLILTGEIAGRTVDPERIWHTRGEEISEGEFAFRMAEIAWCKKHAPSDPLANPWEPVEFNNIPLPF